ncbi:MAG TPA: hypothetical protein VL282_01485 [Tepidisphaeraceae bacterium]|nr:hypothetical protein [Tepidisphaeraceae bacterium]
MSELQPPLIPPVPTPLSYQHIDQLTESKKRFRKIGRAINVANFDAWTVGIFGGGTLIVALVSFSFVGLILGAGMTAVAYFELANAGKLRKLDLDAPKNLAINQVVLGSLLMGYAIYSLLTPSIDMSQYSDLAGAGQMGAKMANDLKSMTALIYNLVYFSLIAVAIFAQGGTALFYLSRKKHLQSYLQHTPPWILEMQRAGIRV